MNPAPRIQLNNNKSLSIGIAIRQLNKGVLALHEIENPNAILAKHDGSYSRSTPYTVHREAIASARSRAAFAAAQAQARHASAVAAAASQARLARHQARLATQRAASQRSHLRRRFGGVMAQVRAEAPLFGNDYLKVLQRIADRTQADPNRAFTVRMRSLASPDKHVDMAYSNHWHFKHMLQAEMSGRDIGSDPLQHVAPVLRNLFSRVSYDLEYVLGGCCRSRADTERTIVLKLARHTVTVTLDAVLARKQNCGFAAVDHLLGRREVTADSYDRWRTYRAQCGIAPDTPVSPDALRAYYESVDGTGSFCVVTAESLTSDDVAVVAQSDCVWYQSNHYRPIASIAAVERAARPLPKTIDRRILTWDIETIVCRDTYASKNGSLVSATMLKDTITHVAYEVAGCSTGEVKHHAFTTTTARSSVRQFIDWLRLQAERNRFYRCYAHNSARFDSLFLMSAFAADEMPGVEFLTRGCSLLSIEFMHHTFQDTYQFLSQSLDSLCVAFKPSQCKLTTGLVFTDSAGEVHHLTSTELCFWRAGSSDAQRKAEAAKGLSRDTMVKPMLMSEFLAYEAAEPAFWKLYNDYCMADVLSLREIWVTFVKVVDRLLVKANRGGPKILSSCRVTSKTTIGALAKSVFVYLNRTNPYMRSVLEFVGSDLDKYAFMRLMVRGGISHCNKPGEYTAGVFSYDVVSQYPSAMMTGSCPSGPSVWTDEYWPRRHGYYHLEDVNFGDGRRMFRQVAIKAEGKALDWGCERMPTLYVDSFTLKSLMKRFPRMTYGVVRGLVSHSCVPGSSVFAGFVTPFFDAKREQDALRASKSGAYNEAVRSSCKLFLNALSGKLVERTEKYTSLRVWSKRDGEDAPVGKVLNGQPLEETGKASMNPYLGLGLMVYGESRDMFFKFIDCLPRASDSVLAVETDCFYAEAKDEAHFLDRVKGMQHPILRIGNELGNVEPDKRSDCAWFIGKKLYALSNVGLDGRYVDIKTTWKGAPASSCTADGTRLALTSGDQVRRLHARETVELTYSTMVKSLYGPAPIILGGFQTRSFRKARDLPANVPPTT